MSLFCGFALCVAAWLLLSLGLPKHFQALRGRAPSEREMRMLRGTGWITLAISLALFVTDRGWEYGPVFWFAVLMLTAVAWTLTLAFVARKK